MPEGENALRMHLGAFAVATAVVYATVFFAQVRIVRKLEQLKPSMLSGTRKMHADLNRALIALALCPMVTSALPIIFFLVEIFFAKDEADSLVIFASTVLSSIAFWNPITTCFLIRPYRTALIRYIRRTKDELKSIPSLTATSK